MAALSREVVPWSVLHSCMRVGPLLNQSAPVHECAERLVFVERHPDGEDAGVVFGKGLLGDTGGQWV